RRGSVSDGAQRQAPPTEQTCRRRPGRKRDPHRLLPRSGGTAVLRVLERAVPQQGEGIQRRPLPWAVPLERPAGDPTRITAAAGAIDPLTTRSQPGSELLKTLTHGVGQPPLRVRTNTDEVIAAAGDDLDQI